MIWWYKDIFINRSSNTHIEHHSTHTKKRTHTMVKAYKKLNSVIQSLVVYQQQRRLNQRSYQVLSQLDDHYLCDIGLINEDLHLLRKGETPNRFQHTSADIVKPAAMRLVADVGVADKKVDNQLFEPEHFEKAA